MNSLPGNTLELSTILLQADELADLTISPEVLFECNRVRRDRARVLEITNEFAVYPALHTRRSHEE